MVVRAVEDEAPGVTVVGGPVVPVHALHDVLGAVGIRGQHAVQVQLTVADVGRAVGHAQMRMPRLNAGHDVVIVEIVGADDDVGQQIRSVDTGGNGRDERQRESESSENAIETGS